MITYEYIKNSNESELYFKEIEKNKKIKKRNIKNISIDDSITIIKCFSDDGYFW